MDVDVQAANVVSAFVPDMAQLQLYRDKSAWR